MALRIDRVTEGVSVRMLRIDSEERVQKAAVRDEHFRRLHDAFAEVLRPRLQHIDDVGSCQEVEVGAHRRV